MADRIPSNVYGTDGVHAETHLRDSGFVMTGHHCHSCYELFYVHRGECRVLINERIDLDAESLKSSGKIMRGSTCTVDQAVRTFLKLLNIYLHVAVQISVLRFNTCNISNVSGGSIKDLCLEDLL